MAAALKTNHDLSDSESEPNISTSSKSANSGLIPRKDNFRKCKGRNSNATTKSNEATDARAKVPIIDNGKNNSEKSSQAEIIKDRHQF